MKKLNVKKKEKKILFKFEIFCGNNHPTRHINYELIDITPGNKSLVAIKLPSTNFEGFLKRTKRIKYWLRVNSAKYIAPLLFQIYQNDHLYNQRL